MLKKQISAHQKLISQEVESTDKALFCFSHKKKPLSLEQLQRNLDRLIDLTGQTACPDTRLRQKLSLNPGSLVGKHIEHLWIDDHQDKWWQDKVLSMEVTEDAGVVYQIMYWDTQSAEDADEEDAFDVTLAEVLEGLGVGSLNILDI